jgi:hypothetical protein
MMFFLMIYRHLVKTLTLDKVSVFVFFSIIFYPRHEGELFIVNFFKIYFPFHPPNLDNIHDLLLF